MARHVIVTIGAFILAAAVISCGTGFGEGADTVVIVSADIEWRETLHLFDNPETGTSPYGECLERVMSGRRVIFFHGGWGKISAAGSAQYAINRWEPELLVNLGTCGGFEGRIEKRDILVVNEAVTYDITEQMGDSSEAIRFYTTPVSLFTAGSVEQAPVKGTVVTGRIVSGDRDLIPGEIPELKRKYGAVAGDWESSAIAFIAAKNGTRLHILRGVSDVVTSSGSEAYGSLESYRQGTRVVMKKLLTILPYIIQ